MIRAVELLGEVRAPAWRGKPRVVHLTIDDDECDAATAPMTPGQMRSAAGLAVYLAKLRARQEAERPMWAEIARLIAGRRDAMGMTRDQVAELIGCGTTTVGEWEKGARPIRPHWWARIEAVLGVGVAAMVGK